MNYLKIKNWKKFQHFKERTPPWIKLYSDLLDDYVYNNLPIESQAIAPLIWLMASQQKEPGTIEGDINLISYRLRRHNDFMTKALRPLIEATYFEASNGFFNILGDKEKNAIDINIISSGYQDAIPETYSKEEYSKEVEQKQTIDDFEKFWIEYGKIGNKQNALKAFNRIKGVDYEIIIAGLRKYQNYCRAIKQEQRFIKHASSWLNARGWEDEYAIQQHPIEKSKHQRAKEALGLSGEPEAINITPANMF